MKWAGMLWAAGMVLALASVAGANATDAWAGTEPVAGPTSDGASTTHNTPWSFSGIISRSHPTVYCHVKASYSGTMYGSSMTGYLISHGGLTITVYRCRHRGRAMSSTSDLILLKGPFVITRNSAFSGKYLCSMTSRYYYYLRVRSATRGRYGSFLGSATLKYRLPY